MNPALVREIEDLLQPPAARATLKAEKQLAVAAGMLSAASAREMTATTVVGVLGSDDVDTFRSLVADISDEYGLEATVKIQVGSYSVRFSRPSLNATWR
jgi:hypothetical protein